MNGLAMKWADGMRMSKLLQRQCRLEENAGVRYDPPPFRNAGISTLPRGTVPFFSGPLWNINSDQLAKSVPEPERIWSRGAGAIRSWSNRTASCNGWIFRSKDGRAHRKE